MIGRTFSMSGSRARTTIVFVRASEATVIVPRADGRIPINRELRSLEDPPRLWKSFSSSPASLVASAYCSLNGSIRVGMSCSSSRSISFLTSFIPSCGAITMMLLVVASEAMVMSLVGLIFSVPLPSPAAWASPGWAVSMPPSSPAASSSSISCSS